MKINYKHILSLVTVGVACGMTLPSAAGPNVIITPPAPPTVVITAPAPPPVTVAVVPDDYVYDGTEYVGVIGGQYYYLGPDNTWVVMDPVRMHRFQGYMNDHKNWRDHMTHNTKYRNQDRDKDRDRTEPARDTHSNQPLDDKKDHYNDHTGPP